MKHQIATCYWRTVHKLPSEYSIYQFCRFLGKTPNDALFKFMRCALLYMYTCILVSVMHRTGMNYTHTKCIVARTRQSIHMDHGPQKHAKKRIEYDVSIWVRIDIHVKWMKKCHRGAMCSINFFLYIYNKYSWQCVQFVNASATSIHCGCLERFVFRDRLTR